MDSVVLWLVAVLLYILLLSPSVTYLLYNWDVRRREILSGLSSTENRAIMLYFDQFHPDYRREIPNPEDRFKAYYSDQFGRKRFIPPLVLFALLSGIVVFQARSWIEAAFRGDAALQPQFVALFSILGAYMWVLYDQITRWWRSDLSPGDFWWASFRFAISVPMGYAVAEVVPKDMPFVAAFVLGAFPTGALLGIMRKLGKRTLKLDESAGGLTNELERLQGIDSDKAERFGLEGITTICQLAYADPIRLTILTNLGYSFIVDCMSQALLWIYVEDDIGKFRTAALRSAYEIESLWQAMKSQNQADRDEANRLVEAFSTELKWDPAKLRNILSEVAEDPYTEFLYTSWSGDVIA